MKNFLKLNVSCLYFALTICQANAQNDASIGQYLMSQSMINPAYNGIYDMGNITAISRGQWVGIQGAPFTHLFSGYSSISDHSAAGVMVMLDSYGINSTTDFMASYAYKIDMLGDILSFGLQGGRTSYVQDFNKLNVEVFDDPAAGSGRYSQSVTNIGFGVMYKTDIYYLGLAGTRLSKTVNQIQGVEFNSYAPSFNLSGGMLITPLNFFKIKPSFLVRYSDAKLTYDLNGQVLINEAIWLGISSKNLNTVGLNFIYTSEDIYHFGYSFEFPFNEIGTVGYGTHEVMISMDLKLVTRHMRSPRFF